jgi:hypothetical protein
MKVQTRREHAAPPAVCPPCLDAFLRSIGTDDERIAFVHCPHRGGTLCRVHARAGVIVNWRLSAPVTLAEAEQAIAEHGRLLEKVGLLPPAPGPADVH